MISCVKDIGQVRVVDIETSNTAKCCNKAGAIRCLAAVGKLTRPSNTLPFYVPIFTDSIANDVYELHDVAVDFPN
jgi:hypothetical protein